MLIVGAMFYYVIVTERIFTLCLCCCTLYVDLSVFFCLRTSFSLLRMVYVFLYWTSEKDAVYVRARKKARGDINSLSQIPSKKERRKKKKRKKEEHVAVARAYFQPATSSTVYIIHFMADFVTSAMA